MAFLYETHIHTNASSLCGVFTPEEIVHRFKGLGYTGIFVTDHFFNGNTCVPYKNLSWEEAIDQYCSAYERAKAEGDKIGLDVFFGFENSYSGNDILTYGLGKDWLKAHPEIMQMSIRKYCEFARSEGGFVVQPHPFREAGYIEVIRLLPRSVDAVEVINGHCSDFQNDRAREYALNYDLAPTAGSDFHGRTSFLTAVSSEKRLASVADYCEAVRSRSVTPIVFFDKREEKILCD